jgi:putative transposase
MPHLWYELLGMTADERQSVYRELFRHQLEPELIYEIRKATNGNFVLGNARFQKKISNMLGRPCGSGLVRKARWVNALLV